MAQVNNRKMAKTALVSNAPVGSPWERIVLHMVWVNKVLKAGQKSNI